MIYFLFACLIGLSSCSNSTTDSTDLPNTTTPSGDQNYTADPTCPYLDHLTYSYYPEDCTKFYECDHGKKYLMDCPDGLYWNTVYDYCDYPENVDCSRSNTTTTRDYTIDPTCPYLDDLTYDYYPGNCSKFYECDHGKRYVMDCPAGLYWNTEKNYCDYLQNVDCSRQNVTTSATSTDSTGDTNETTATTIASVCQGFPDGSLIPDQNDCSKFYECVGGKPIEFSCPAGTLWDKERKVCDYAANVDC